MFSRTFWQRLPDISEFPKYRSPAGGGAEKRQGAVIDEQQKRARRRPISEPAMVRTIDLDQLADVFTPKPVFKTIELEKRVRFQGSPKIFRMTLSSTVTVVRKYDASR
jgi:hypothetical protein